MSDHEQYAGYLFVYFTDDGKGGGEEIYFALSKGNEPLHWQELNGGEPVLTSRLGEKGVRDPYIIRSPQGDKFFLLGTDLKAHEDGNWQRAVTEGSRSILIWESQNWFIGPSRGCWKLRLQVLAAPGRRKRSLM